MTVIALTGSSGMTGIHMKALLELNKVKIIEVDRNMWDLATWKTHDEIDAVFPHAEAIFHFGAFVPRASANNIDANNTVIRDVFDINVRSCVAIAEWALHKNVPVVYLYGATVYRDPHALNIVEEAEKTTNSFGGWYGFSKYMAEQVFDHFVHRGLKVIILRPSSIYGVGMPNDRLVARFIQMASEGQKITVTEPVTNSVNFIHASDISNAALQALNKESWGTFNIAANRNVSILEVASECVSQIGRGTVEIVKSTANLDPFTRFDLNYDKAKRSFDYKPSIDIIDGITAMIDGKTII